MSNDTTVTIIGNLTTDPDFRITQSGVGVVNFTLISKSRVFDRDAGEWRDHEVVFMRCTAWREHAENVNDSLRKGSRVIVSGKLRQRTYVTRENERRTVTELDIDEIGPTLRFATAAVKKVERIGVRAHVPDADVAQHQEFDDSNQPDRALAAVGGGTATSGEAPY